MSEQPTPRLTVEISKDWCENMAHKEEGDIEAGNQGHNAPCYYCDQPCNSLAGNPALWPIPLCHEDEPGKVKWHHIGCVSERLRRLAAAEAERDRLTNQLSRNSEQLLAENERLTRELDDCLATREQEWVKKGIASLLERLANAADEGKLLHQRALTAESDLAAEREAHAQAEAWAAISNKAADEWAAIANGERAARERAEEALRELKEFCDIHVLDEEVRNAEEWPVGRRKSYRLMALLDKARTALREPRTLSEPRELKPCPFCSGESVYLTFGELVHWIECRMCHASSGRLKNRDAVTVAWNRRVPVREKSNADQS